jgi:hypothetical protein
MNKYYVYYFLYFLLDVLILCYLIVLTEKTAKHGVQQRRNVQVCQTICLIRLNNYTVNELDKSREIFAVNDIYVKHYIRQQISKCFQQCAMKAIRVIAVNGRVAILTTELIASPGVTVMRLIVAL